MSATCLVVVASGSSVVWVVRLWERKEGDGGWTTVGENDDIPTPPRRWRNDNGETIQLYCG